MQLGAQVPRLAAVAGPLVVVALAFAWVMGVDPAQVPGLRDRRALRERDRAGHVMNGITFYTDVALQLERDLREYEPRVLVVGNSLAHANLDERVVARRLGIRPTSVGVVSVPNSVSSHWYAILANRVFGADHHPELVIVVASLQAMLVAEPYSDASRQALTVHLRDEEPVLDAYVHREPAWIERWKRQRLLWRDALLDGVRDRAVGVVYDGSTEASMDRLFRDRNLRADAPTLDADLASTALLAPEASLLGPLVDLVLEQGAGIVFVRPPVGPKAPPDVRDVVPDGFAERSAGIVEQRGQVFVDAARQRLPPGSFDNPRHMSEEGATVFTIGLAPVLQEVWDRTKAVRAPAQPEAPGEGPP